MHDPKKYYQKNKEKIRLRSKKNYLKNRDKPSFKKKRSEYIKKYYKKNKDYFRKYCREYYHSTDVRKLKSLVRTNNFLIKDLMIHKYGSKCFKCQFRKKKKELQLHHVNYIKQPKKGDVMLLCISCHRKIHRIYK